VDNRSTQSRLVANVVDITLYDMAVKGRMIRGVSSIWSRIPNLVPNKRLLLRSRLGWRIVMEK
jgi:hypothetical protein